MIIFYALKKKGNETMTKINKTVESKCEKCRFSHLLASDGFRRYCFFNKEYIEDEKICETCQDFKSRWIEYPIQVNEIETEKPEQYCMAESGSLVRIRPCGKEYGDKTYLGLYLGHQPWMPCCSYDEKTKKLSFRMATNPAIYVFDLKKVIFGAQSWWSVIKSENELRDITKDEINNTWYVKMFKDMVKND